MKFWWAYLKAQANLCWSLVGEVLLTSIPSALPIDCSLLFFSSLILDIRLGLLKEFKLNARLHLQLYPKHQPKTFLLAALARRAHCAVLCLPWLLTFSYRRWIWWCALTGAVSVPLTPPLLGIHHPSATPPTNAFIFTLLLPSRTSPGALAEELLSEGHRHSPLLPLLPWLARQLAPVQGSFSRKHLSLRGASSTSEQQRLSVRCSLL